MHLDQKYVMMLQKYIALSPQHTNTLQTLTPKQHQSNTLQQSEQHFVTKCNENHNFAHFKSNKKSNYDFICERKLNIALKLHIKCNNSTSPEHSLEPSIWRNTWKTII